MPLLNSNDVDCLAIANVREAGQDLGVGAVVAARLAPAVSALPFPRRAQLTYELVRDVDELAGYRPEHGEFGEPSRERLLATLGGVESPYLEAWRPALDAALDRDETPAPVDVPEEDVAELLAAVVRYSLGRATYMPSWTANVVRKHWPKLRASSRELIIEPVEAAVEAADKHHDPTHGLGMDCDASTWRQLLAFTQSA